jgi:hypothetical protein
LAINPYDYEAHDTLDITTGTFAVGGSINYWGETLDNYGTINVASGATLELAPTTPGAEIENGGTISVLGKLEIARSTVLNDEQNGDGSVEPGQVLLGYSASIGSDGHDAVTFTNFSTIKGGGTIGDQHLTLVNNDMIEATSAESLVLNTGTNTIVNQGTIEASNNGLLNIHSNVANGTGTIEAQANGVVDLASVNVSDGLVKIDAGGTLEASGVNTITSSVANQGIIQVESGATLSLTGEVTGNGSVTINGTSTFMLDAAFDEKVSFAALSHGTLVLDNATVAKAFGGSVSGFAVGDAIDLAGFGAHTTYNYSGGALHVNDVEGSVTHTATIDIVGSLTTASFHGVFNGSEVIFTHA